MHVDDLADGCVFLLKSYSGEEHVNLGSGNDLPIIELSGNVALRRGSDTLDGGRLVIDLNSGLSSVDGASAQSGSGQSGRVSGTFAVPDGD